MSNGWKLILDTRCSGSRYIAQWNNLRPIRIQDTECLLASDWSKIVPLCDISAANQNLFNPRTYSHSLFLGRLRPSFVEMISWSISTKECFVGPEDRMRQADAYRTKLTGPAEFCGSDILMRIVILWLKLYVYFNEKIKERPLKETHMYGLFRKYWIYGLGSRLECEGSFLSLGNILPWL